MASKRLKAFNRSSDEELRVDMSPMIDMVFLLLIFFLVNASMVIVKMDKKILIPVAKNAKPQEEKNGRIVINVYKDGSYAPEDYENTKFSEDNMDDVLDYIREAKEGMEEVGYRPKLHLRGDQDSMFKHSRKVIRVAAQAGINDVIFVSYSTEAAAKQAQAQR